MDVIIEFLLIESNILASDFFKHYKYVNVRSVLLFSSEFKCIKYGNWEENFWKVLLQKIQSICEHIKNELFTKYPIKNYFVTVVNKYLYFHSLEKYVYKEFVMPNLIFNECNSF